MRRSTTLLFTLLAATAGSLRAQDEGGITVTLSVSPSFVDFGSFGGRFGAAVVRLSAAKDFSRITGAELSAFALAPLGGMTAIPECIPGGDCRTRTTPSVLTGALASFIVRAGDSGLQGVAGGGTVTAQGGEGFDRRSTAAGLVGLDFIPNSNNRFAPTFSIRFLRLAAPIAGARQLLLPGVGLRF